MEMNKSTVDIFILTCIIGYVVYQFILWLIPYLESENEKKKSLLSIKKRQEEMKLNNYELKDLDKLLNDVCLLYTSPSPRDRTRSRMPSSA